MKGGSWAGKQAARGQCGTGTGERGVVNGQLTSGSRALCEGVRPKPRTAPSTPPHHRYTHHLPWTLITRIIFQLKKIKPHSHSIKFPLILCPFPSPFIHFTFLFHHLPFPFLPFPFPLPKLFPLVPFRRPCPLPPVPFPFPPFTSPLLFPLPSTPPSHPADILYRSQSLVASHKLPPYLLGI